MRMFGIISAKLMVFQSDLYGIMKSKHTKNRFYQKKLRENWKWQNLLNHQLVKKLCELTKNRTLRYWDERNGGNVSVRLEASEVEGYEDVKWSETCPRLRVRRFNTCGLLLLSNRDRTLLQKRDKPTASWFRIGSYFRRRTKAELLWGFEDGGKPTSEFAEPLNEPHRTTQRWIQIIKWSSIATNKLNCIKLHTNH